VFNEFNTFYLQKELEVGVDVIFDRLNLNEAQ
jgi:hypothetical protein